MKKLFFVYCFAMTLTLTAFSQDYKIAEPYGTTETSGKISHNSSQKYTYLYDTSLIQAIKLKDEHRVKMLLFAQVNPNEKNDEGFTPLYFAAQYLEPETLSMLIDKGAMVNLASTYNLTPLMAAAAAGRADNVQVLLEYGADPNVLDYKNFTALDHAFNNRQVETAILLNPITTVKKRNINYDAWIEETINPQPIVEPQQQEVNTVVNQNFEDDTVAVVPEYNPTLAEIDAKIEKTRQSLSRLINLRRQIAASEQAAASQNTQTTYYTTRTVNSGNPAPAKTTTTYTKTTTTKTTTTKNKKPAKVATSVNN